MKIRDYIVGSQNIAEEYEDKTVDSGETSVSDVCYNTIDKLEELDNFLFTAFSDKSIKIIIDRISNDITKDMTLAQRESFDYGVDLVLDLLKQAAKHEMENGCVMFYHPNVKEFEEMGIDEVLDLA